MDRRIQILPLLLGVHLTTADAKEHPVFVDQEAIHQTIEGHLHPAEKEGDRIPILLIGVV